MENELLRWAGWIFIILFGLGVVFVLVQGFKYVMHRLQEGWYNTEASEERYMTKKEVQAEVKESIKALQAGAVATEVATK